jgi:formyltetrahydrofolate-dependent phosphoribosylglycinamide formyltransferase
MDAKAPLRAAVLLSGSGRTLENLLAVERAGQLPVEIVAVVSSRPDVRGVRVAEEAGLPVAVVRRRDYPDDAAFSDAVYGWLAPFRPRLLLLAGFLCRLTVPPQWRGRILNIHPALLSEAGPAGRGFYGERVHAAVLAGGATVSGASVHVVTDEYDAGPVVLEERVPVLPDDTPETLAARVFAAECALYPAAIRAYVQRNPWLAEPPE